MSDVRLTPSAEDDLAARRAHWHRRQRVLFVIAGVLLVANIIRIAWPLVARQMRAAKTASTRRILEQTYDFVAPVALMSCRSSIASYSPRDYSAGVADKTVLNDSDTEEVGHLLSHRKRLLTLSMLIPLKSTTEAQSHRD